MLEALAIVFGAGFFSCIGLIIVGRTVTEKPRLEHEEKMAVIHMQEKAQAIEINMAQDRHMVQLSEHASESTDVGLVWDITDKGARPGPANPSYVPPAGRPRPDPTKRGRR